MWPLALLALRLLQSPSARPHIPRDPIVIGVWKFDPKSLQLNLTERALKEMRRQGPAGREAFEKGKASLAGLFGGMSLRFGPDHRFQLTGPHGGVVAGGRWTMKGSSIVATADKKGLHMMDLTLSDSGKQIFGVQRNPGVGETKVTLVRR